MDFLVILIDILKVVKLQKYDEIEYNRKYCLIYVVEFKK